MVHPIHDLPYRRLSIRLQMPGTVRFLCFNEIGTIHISAAICAEFSKNFPPTNTLALTAGSSPFLLAITEPPSSLPLRCSLDNTVTTIIPLFEANVRDICLFIAFIFQYFAVTSPLITKTLIHEVDKWPHGIMAEKFA